MPVSTITLQKGKSPDYVRALSGGLHGALVEAFDVPPDDRFLVIHQLEPDALVYDRHYLGGPRSGDFVLIQITAGRERSPSVKAAFYQRLVALLAEAPGLRPEDVMVVVTTTTADGWSFGGGRTWQSGAKA